MRKTRQLLINPQFQLRFIAYLSLVSCATSAVFWGAFVFFFWKVDEMAKLAGLPADHVFYSFASEQRALLGRLFLASAVTIFGLVTVSGLMISHRVVGPLERLKGHLLAAARGETTADLRFRKRDAFDDVAECVNAVMARLRAERERAGRGPISPD